MAMRIALLDAVSPPDILLSVAAMEKISQEQIGSIQQLLADIPYRASSPDDGIGLIAPIFESLDNDTRNNILARMNQESESLVSKIDERLFFFEDLLCFDNRGLQTIHKEVDIKELAVALKGASAGANIRRKGICAGRPSATAQPLPLQAQVTIPAKVTSASASEVTIGAPEFI